MSPATLVLMRAMQTTLSTKQLDLLIITLNRLQHVNFPLREMEVRLLRGFGTVPKFA
jgi:hypothetical protein